MLSNCSLAPQSLPDFGFIPMHEILTNFGNMTILSEFLWDLKRLNIFQVFIGYVYTYLEEMISAFTHLYACYRFF